MKVCALGSLYHGEKPHHLRAALESVFSQSLEIPVVLIVDGPITPLLRTALNEFINQIHKIIELPENVGLGPALNEGIKKLGNEFDYLIRFDTDDINEANRFEVLVRAIELNKADVISSNMIEFSDEEDGDILGLRAVPSNSEAIVRSIHYRNPFNHPAVAFRISSVLSVGGYEDVRLFEDWYLWAKMIKADARVCNLVNPLVRFRGGKATLSRRHGWTYAKLELTFFLYLYKLGLPGRGAIFFILPTRMLIRLLPARVFRWVYYMFRRLF